MSGLRCRRLKFSASYTHDGNLKRVKSGEDGQVTYSVYSAPGGSILFREEVSAGRVTDYISAGGAGVRLVNGAAEYTHSDLLGSPRAATGATGALLWRESYTPFGEARLRPPANAGNIGFTGHVEDAATGLTYMQARYYDPVIARFLSADPIGYQDQLNLYAYVHNDPVNNTDPTGEFCVPCLGFVVGVVGDVAVQAVQNGGFNNIDAGQALRAGAIGAVSGGLSSLGKSLVSQAAQAGVKTSTVSAVNAGRNATIASGAAIAEAVNAGATGNEVLSSAAIDLATGKLGGVVMSEIEGGDAVVRETGEHLSDIAGGMIRGFSDAQQQQHLHNDQSYLSGEIEHPEFKENSCQISGFDNC